MTAVPRLRDTLSIQRLQDGEAVLFVISDGDKELFRLTGDGWFLLTLLDGVSEERVVQGRYRDQVGRDMPLEELREFCAALSEASVLNATDRAVAVLSYLGEQGVSYRAARPNRREVSHPDAGDPDDPRVSDRRAGDDRAARFQTAIAHLNDGRLEQGLSAFRLLAEEDPGDVRVGEMIGHLEFLVAAEANPALKDDRRDPSWDAFDRALATLLGAGKCPSCGDPIEVQLYRPNRCGACGASFTSTALRRADDERRDEDR